MAPLAFEGACLCGIPQEHPVMQQLFRSYCKALQISKRQLGEYERICAAFEDAGIDDTT